MPHPASAQSPPPDSYLDAAAETLVRQARARRTVIDHRIHEYETVARERLSIHYRILARERLLYRRETVSRVHWFRDDTVRIEVLGAREVVPPVVPFEQPTDIAGWLPQLAFDPADAELLLRTDSRSIRHPLAPGAETDYRYASGDTAVIQLPDGRDVRLRELRVSARRREPQLVNASFWLDADTHDVVRAYLTLAREYDAERDADPRRRPPALLRPMRAELGFIAIEYALWELNWWLPRLVAAEGSFSIRGTQLPLRYERTYDDYRVRAVDVPILALDTLADRPPRCRPPGRFTVRVNVGRDTTGREPADTARARARPSPTDTTIVTSTQDDCDRHWVVAPAAGIDLVRSAHLPPSIFSDDALLSADELRAIRRRIDALPAAPWSFSPPIVQFGILDPRTVRFNRVEGLSIGPRATLDLGRTTLLAEARAGVPSAEIGGELALERVFGAWRVRGGAYRRVRSMDPWLRPFTVGGTLGALLLGSDGHDYFRASGAELRGEPAGLRSRWLEWRLFAERHEALASATEFSVRHLLDDRHSPSPNLAADRADQLGAAITMRWQRGLDPARPRIDGALALDAETGSFDFARAALRARLGAPLPGPFVAGFELAGGSSIGTLPVQRAWRLGGSPTVRGYDAASAAGDAFWRARAELGTALPLARVSLFSDLGWAGDRAEIFAPAALSTRAALWSAGIGASALDGMLRLDVARAVRGRAAWHLHLYFDGIL